MSNERDDAPPIRCADPRLSASDARAMRVDRRRVLTGTAAGLAAGLLGLEGNRSLAAPLHQPERVAVGPRQSEGPTLTLALDGSPSDLDPHLAADARSSLAVLGIYEGLIALKGAATDEYVGLLAESWGSNDDLSTWTFTLRDGAVFQDGSPCDAEAVRLSFERYMTVGYGAGADWMRFVPGIDAISAPDSRTVVFDLGRPQPLFEAAVAASYGTLVVNANLLREHDEDGDWGRAWAQINAEGCGTGPYRLAEFEPASLLRLEKNETWWGGPELPAYQQIVLRVVPENATRRQLLEAGEVDLTMALTPEDFNALRDVSGVVVADAPSVRVDYLYLNPAGALASPEARQALSWAFPYAEVIDGLWLGYADQPAGPAAPELRGFSPEAFTYTTDLDKARELLAAAGIAEGTTLELALEPGIQTVKLVAQLFQANLAELGLAVSITEIETTSYVGLLYGDATPEERPDIFWWAWWPPYNDAWSQINAIVGCGMDGAAGGANFTGYCNEDAQALLDEAVAASDPAAYEAALAEVQRIITADDPPGIFYAHPVSTIAYREGIEGIVLNPINILTFYYQDIRPAG